MEILTDRKVGEIMREERQLKGLTQKELANFLGVTFQQVQKYETGKNRISVATFLKMCRFFNLSPDFILKSESEIALETLENRTQIRKFIALPKSTRTILLKLMQDLQDK